MEKVSELNLEFYMNRIKSEPDGDFIENILSTWKGDYDKLNSHCGYIQWLFPNRQPGKNPAAHPLTEVEAELISESPDSRDRVKRAFEMMLDFFGMELVGSRQFQLTANADERLKHINEWGSHSFLYINRILFALKELGFKDLIYPWMKFLADLIYKEKKLDKAVNSFEEFWMSALEDTEQVEMAALLQNYKNL